MESAYHRLKRNAFAEQCEFEFYQSLCPKWGIKDE